MTAKKATPTDDNAPPSVLQEAGAELIKRYAVNASVDEAALSAGIEEAIFGQLLRTEGALIAKRIERERLEQANLNDRVRFTPLDEFLREKDETQEWLADGLIALDTLTQWLGVKESFKSMAMLWLLVAAAYGSRWLERDIPALPSYYVSGEKRRRSIRDRLQHLTDAEDGPAQADIIVVHRAGLSLDSRNQQFLRLVDEIDKRNERVIVGLDTITTLAPAGFNEVSGESWALVLSAIRMLTDLAHPATVIGSFHPSKEDKGGVKMQSRGHTSFGGEADGALIFSRPNFAAPDATIHCRPKDGEYSRIPVQFDRETFRLVIKDLMLMPLDGTTILHVVGQLGTPDFDTIWDAYGYTSDGKHRFGKDKLRDVLKAAVDAHQIDQIGGGNVAYTYALREQDDAID